MLKRLFGKKDQPAQKTDLSPQEEAMQNAIEEMKKSDPLIGVKLGSKEIVQRILDGLKDNKGVHIESLLGIIGSLAGYACHVACREELIDSGKHKEKDVFMIVGDKDGNQYYFGDLPNKPLAEDQLCIWSLVAGITQDLAGADAIPDINAIFSHVSNTLGDDDFGIPQTPEQHKPGDLPLNYVKTLWQPLLPIIDKFCDRPMERPILLGLAAQQAIEMGKDVIPPAIAARIVMECAIPMSKIGPEWLQSGEDASKTPPLHGQIKKLFFWSLILLFVLAQSFFIYGLLQPETVKLFTQLWDNFGVEQTAYSKFVFSTVQWWVALPVLCLGLAFLQLYSTFKWLPLATIFLSFLGTVALYWSVYAPALLVHL